MSSDSADADLSVLFEYIPVKEIVEQLSKKTTLQQVFTALRMNGDVKAEQKILVA